MVPESRRPVVGMDALAVWCRRWLGAPPAAQLFEAGYLSTVRGLRLADGREVVVKVRPGESRLAGCAAVHQALWTAGFPCPEPLAGPQPLDGHTATAEALFPGAGEPPPVIGHGDWHPGNLCWHGPQLIAVHDWDSVICQPEPAIAGLAAVSFRGIDDPAGLASIADSAAFLDAYQHARGRRWTPADYAASWAAGLWQRAFDAKVQSLGGSPEQVLTRHEAGARLRLAGLDPGCIVRT